MKKQEKQKRQNGKATIIVTYNSVENYPAGTYVGKNGPLVIYSHENTKTWGERDAERKLSQISHQLYGKADPSDVKEIFMYVGLYAKRGALAAASRFARQGNKVTLVACDCDSESKRALAEDIGAKLVWSECGGRQTLKRIAEETLAN
jgi:hypothetical protein